MDDTRGDLLAESNRELVRLLHAELRDAGRITFARFMDVALYHPEFGYYATEAIRAGFEGDFLTGPETDPIFGHALARQIAECWDRLDRPESFTIREFGAGRGTLAEQLIHGLRAERPEILNALRYDLTDVNAARIEEARARLAEVGPEISIGTGDDGPITGVLLANELLDAMPFHRLRYVNGELREVWVTWQEGWFRDEIGPLSQGHLAAPFEHLRLEEGQFVELSPAAGDWAALLGRQLQRGYALFIDYGYPATELYSSARAGGTLKAYSEHLASEDPFRRVGRQDITAHVDFSAVSAAAQLGGFVELGLTTQAYFFAGLGIEQLLLRLQQSSDPYRYVNAREAVLHLLDPRGLGRFRVLVLGKQVERDPPLSGLSFALR